MTELRYGRADYQNAARCGTWMPLANQPCGRCVNHRGDHRTRTAMDDIIIKRRKPVREARTVAAQQRTPCMDDAEWHAYALAAAEAARVACKQIVLPCFDCLPAFAAAMRSVDRCNGRPGMRTRLPDSPKRSAWREAARRTKAARLSFRPATGHAEATVSGRSATEAA